MASHYGFQVICPEYGRAGEEETLQSFQSGEAEKVWKGGILVQRLMQQPGTSPTT